jgi:hypothetical protein
MEFIAIFIVLWVIFAGLAIWNKQSSIVSILGGLLFAIISTALIASIYTRHIEPTKVNDTALQSNISKRLVSTAGAYFQESANRISMDIGFSLFCDKRVSSMAESTKSMLALYINTYSTTSRERKKAKEQARANMLLASIAVKNGTKPDCDKFSHSLADDVQLMAQSANQGLISSRPIKASDLKL